jgi:hypothetical protein
MNEHEPAASQTDPAVPPQPEPESPSLLRKILFGILAVMIVALIYEYGFVLRSYRNAENTIDDMIEQSSALSDEETTPQAVQQRFGKQPLSVETENEYLVEHYQWRRWLPWKTFDIYVVYQAGEPPTLFYSTRPHPPGPGDLPVKYEAPAFAGDVEMPDLSSSPDGGAETDLTAEEDTPDPNVGAEEETPAPSEDAEEETAAPSAGEEDAPAAESPAEEDAPAAESPAEDAPGTDEPPSE